MVDIESMAQLVDIYDETSKEHAIQSASIDPRQRMEETQRETFSDIPSKCREGLVPEQFNMTPQLDHSMVDFDELDNLEEREVHRSVHEREYRGEDAIERFRLAEGRIVQEAVMSIEGNEIDGEDDDDGDCPGEEFSETEDEKSTNVPFQPGWRADKVRIRNLARRRQQPNRAPSNAWLELEEPPSARMRPGCSSPLLMRQG